MPLGWRNPGPDHHWIWVKGSDDDTSYSSCNEALSARVTTSNISLINRHYLPWLPLAPYSGNNDHNKTTPQIEQVDTVTPYRANAFTDDGKARIERIYDVRKRMYESGHTEFYSNHQDKQQVQRI
jgi:hypothetical protein